MNIPNGDLWHRYGCMADAKPACVNNVKRWRCINVIAMMITAVCYVRHRYLIHGMMYPWKTTDFTRTNSRHEVGEKKYTILTLFLFSFTLDKGSSERRLARESHIWQWFWWIWSSLGIERLPQTHHKCVTVMVEATLHFGAVFLDFPNILWRSLTKQKKCSWCSMLKNLTMDQE